MPIKELVLFLNVNKFLKRLNISIACSFNNDYEYVRTNLYETSIEHFAWNWPDNIFNDEDDMCMTLIKKCRI